MSALQLSLWSDYASEVVSVAAAADRLGVSRASINNWINEGVLDAVKKGYVTEQSIEFFLRNSAGVDRLVSRANKQKKNSHNTSQVSQLVTNGIEVGKSGDVLAQEYENILSESYRNKEGIYYTPQHIVEDMLSVIDGDVGDKTFLEPCCGTGNFVVAAIKRGFKPENIYAYDTDTNALKIAEYRVKELCGKTCNFINGDFLETCRFEQNFDFIFTNPPWGKKIAKSQKARLSKLCEVGKSDDSCSLFVAKCLSVVSENGLLGFLVPESFFYVSSFADIRKVVLNHEIELIKDYGKFGKLLTSCHSLILSKTISDNENILCCAGKRTLVREKKSFIRNSNAIINFTVTEDESHVIEHLLRQPHITLRGNARWGLGIVTGNNKKLLHESCQTDDVPIYRGMEISKTGLKHNKYFINRDLTLCRQVAPIALYYAPEKIVYRFISDSLVCCLDTSGSLILNSANMLIVNGDFPLSNRQVADLLNSDLMTWLFRKLFNTRKVLRGDLELLPIFNGYFAGQIDFDELKLLQYLNIEKYNGTYRIKK